MTATTTPTSIDHDNHSVTPNVPHIVTPPRGTATGDNETAHTSQSPALVSSADHPSSTRTSNTNSINSNNSSSINPAATTRRAVHVSSSDLDDSNNDAHNHEENHDHNNNNDDNHHRFHDIRSKFENRSSSVPSSSSSSLPKRNRTSVSPRETLINQIKDNENSPDRSPPVIISKRLQQQHPQQEHEEEQQEPHPQQQEQRVLIKEVIKGRVVMKEVLVDPTAPAFSSPARTGTSSEHPSKLSSAPGGGGGSSGVGIDHKPSPSRKSSFRSYLADDGRPSLAERAGNLRRSYSSRSPTPVSLPSVFPGGSYGNTPSISPTMDDKTHDKPHSGSFAHSTNNTATGNMAAAAAAAADSVMSMKLPLPPPPTPKPTSEIESSQHTQFPPKSPTISPMVHAKKELTKVNENDFPEDERERASKDGVGQEGEDDGGIGARMLRSESNASEFEMPGALTLNSPYYSRPCSIYPCYI